MTWKRYCPLIMVHPGSGLDLRITVAPLDNPTVTTVLTTTTTPEKFTSTVSTILGTAVT